MRVSQCHVSYRPLRVGWCVEDGAVADLRKAMEWSFCLWGGIFNPMIPVGDETDARSLLDWFRVDVLFPVSSRSAVKAFAEAVSHLRWPPDESLFGPTGPGLLDFAQIVEKLRERSARGLVRPGWKPIMVSWEEEDPLSYAFLALFGRFPSSGELAGVYEAELRNELGAADVHIERDSPVPPDLAEESTVATLAQWELWADAKVFQRPSVFVGRSDRFSDLVNYWNLRAAQVTDIFVDADHVSRLSEFALRSLSVLRETSKEERQRGVFVWSAEDLTDEPFLESLGSRSFRCRAEGRWWEGNMDPGIARFLESHFSTAFVEERDGKTQATIPLAQERFFDGNRDQWFAEQRLIASIELSSPPLREVLRSHRRFFRDSIVFTGNGCRGSWAKFTSRLTPWELLSGLAIRTCSCLGFPTRTS
jgi:hypothetical protein